MTSQARIDCREGEEKERRTAAALILDGDDGALLPPVDGVGESVAGPKAIAIAPAPAPAPAAAGADAEESGAVLVVGEIGEAVEAEAEGVEAGVGGGVVLVDVAEILLENLEPPLLLADAVVPLPVPAHPRPVQPPHLRLAPSSIPQNRHAPRSSHHSHH